MKIKIKVTQEIEKTIDVEFPYYFKYDLMLDEGNTVIYGEIGENLCVEIQIGVRPEYGNRWTKSYELEVTKDSFTRWSCYFEDKHKSSKDEFLAAKKQMEEELSKIG
jgi:hypothetical protein